jgi:NAD(P)H-hydrate repair Nnr-like enzyme with NAD(P)H-hydrate epimerase domain
MTDSSAAPDFKSKTGFSFAGFSPAALSEMHRELRESLQLQPELTAEAASFSMAMVVRAALGLSASGGKVCGLVKDSLAGLVALATFRHLVNAGAEAQVLFLPGERPPSPELLKQFHTLSTLGVTLPDAGDPAHMDSFTEFLKSAHNIIFGVYEPGVAPDEFLFGICELLNEERTPIHCIEAPPGIDVSTGAPHPSALYASSTLSLGAPLVGLNRGKNYVGRHYICDISFSRALYQSHGPDLTPLFSDQPVVQIYPLIPEEEATS